MDLNTVTDVVVVRRRDELPRWQPGDAVLAGGTWLFSEPQIGVRRLVDITGLGWPPAEIRDDGLHLAATCPIGVLSSLVLPPDWTAAPLLRQCASALVASHKICATATVGGNLCLALPAGAMILLAAALDGVVTVWCPDGSDRAVAVTDFVTGAGTCALAPGEVVRSVFLPAAALRGRTAFRKISLSAVGRSAAALVGRRSADGSMSLTVTASTVRPVVLRSGDWDRALAELPDEMWFTDPHGAADWRRSVTRTLAWQVRRELE